MGKIASESIQMFAVADAKVERSGNRMAVISQAVNDELVHGSRESLFALCAEMNPAMDNLRQAMGGLGPIVQEPADLGDPLVAAYYYGQFSVMQTMMNVTASHTISSVDEAYLKEPKTLQVLRAIRDVGRPEATDKRLAEYLGMSPEELAPILAATHRITATVYTLFGYDPETKTPIWTNWLGPCGQIILESCGDA